MTFKTFLEYNKTEYIFHRTSTIENVKSIFKNGFSIDFYGVNGSKYGNGVYANYDIDDTLNNFSIKNYGKNSKSYIIKIELNTERILCFDYKFFKKVFKVDRLDFLSYQYDFFNLKDIDNDIFKIKEVFKILEKESLKSNFYAKNGTLSNFLLFHNCYKKLSEKVDGMFYNSDFDGLSYVIWNIKKAIPISYSSNEGKTFKLK